MGDELLFPKPETKPLLLYGRAREQELLRTSLAKLSDENQTPELVLISGKSGTGKTALAESIKSMSVLFCHGKHDQLFDDDVQPEPLSSWVGVFETLAPQISNQTVQQLQQTMEDEKQYLLTDKFAALRSMLRARRAPVSDLVVSNKLSEEHFLQSAVQFLQGLASQETPLVILVDDLQWADDTSLRLFERALLLPNVRVVGTCRANEVNLGSPICGTLRRIEDQGVAILNIRLDNLSRDSVREMVLKKYEGQYADDFVAKVWEQTNGNAFYTRELLDYLQETGWDLSTSKKSENDFIAELSNDVLVLLQKKVGHMKRQVHATLKVASCLGSEIDPTVVQCLCKFRIDESLQTATKKGLIVRKTNSMYQFAHDRIQLAMYSMIQDRPAFHLQIGRQLWRTMSSESSEQHIFVIHRQIMRGLSLLEKDEDGKNEFAFICSVAGRRAATLSDFHLASQHFRMGLSALGSSPWKRKHYDLCLRLRT